MGAGLYAETGCRHWELNPGLITHPSANWHKVTSLIETNVLPLSLTTTVMLQLSTTPGIHTCVQTLSSVCVSEPAKTSLWRRQSLRQPCGASSVTMYIGRLLATTPTRRTMRRWLTSIRQRASSIHSTSSLHIPAVCTDDEHPSAQFSTYISVRRHYQIPTSVLLMMPRLLHSESQVPNR